MSGEIAVYRQLILYRYYEKMEFFFKEIFLWSWQFLNMLLTVFIFQELNFTVRLLRRMLFYQSDDGNIAD